ncbi:hybrid sensor histidine kinase/response regulator [Amantichitinum ursilacus]|uniref:histidine kinase n=1 Tax=Amantichitinum ursilacus TaxID=857265 RepID=A0A0N0XFQ9_9NEIS|nr:hybrid sensor histidine kinase/response regulator [Amantichitinum ursilacus]KPC49092.1 Signal transduction histidine-protein kinase BarA [Amantichitinum ursilacus]
MAPNEQPALLDIQERTNLLIVDDLQENLMALEALIRRDDVQIFSARSGEQALELVLQHDFALALIDVQMPGMNGFELAELMRGTEKSKHIPIVFVTANDKGMNYAFKGYETGAVDFLHKPLDIHAVKSKINVFIELHQQRLAMRRQLEALQASRAQQEKLLCQLQAAQGELQQAVRIRDDFMSIASHELKTPLTSLKLQNQLRARHLRQGNTAAFAQAKIEKMVETDGRIVEGVLRLIDDMLDISRIRGGKLSFKPEKFDLAEHVREIVDRFDEQLTLVNKGYTLDAPEPVIGEWDRYRLDQVVTNLITNAIRYGANRPIAITVRADNGKAWFSVKDHGIGIAEENQQRIFQLFERAVEFNEMGGLGLGLFIVGQIVEAQGGRITLQSRLGEGSTFTVELPLRPGDPGQC